MNPTDRIVISLEARVWEMVLQLIAKGPYDAVAPVIADIQRQCIAFQKPSLVPDAAGQTAAE